MRMARPLKRRPYDVRITDHGYKRYIERAGPYGGLSRKKLCQHLYTKVNNTIGTGVHFDYPGAARVELFPWFCGVLVLEKNGWVCVTFKNDTEEDEGAVG